MHTKNLATATLLLLISTLVACGSDRESTPKSQSQDVGLTQERIEEAYIWGLPIVAMYRYTVSMGTRVDGINQVFHNRNLFEPGVLPGGANRDTLYSFGWFDLTDEPIVVSLPHFGDRYYVWQMTDMYSNNFGNVGSDLLGKPGNDGNYTFAMVGPEWEGQLPGHVKEFRAPVNIVNVLYRIQARSDRTDISAANKLQSRTETMPLSAYQAGNEETLRVLPSEPWIDYRDALTFGQGTTGEDQRNPEFFAVLHDALTMNPAYAEWDEAILSSTLALLGVGTEGGYDFSSFDAETQALILDAQASAFDRVMALKESGFGPKHAGWQYGPPNHGNWESDFLRRAYATYIGGMWPKPENSTYALAYHDANGQLLVGTDSYTLTFAEEEIPPATKFWSVTAYESGTFDLYPNEHSRHVVGSNHPDTIYGPDGSVSITFSHEQPTATGTNWLPVPEEEFWVAVRFYAPTQEVLDLEYKIPGIERSVSQSLD